MFSIRIPIDLFGLGRKLGEHLHAVHGQTQSQSVYRCFVSGVHHGVTSGKPFRMPTGEQLDYYVLLRKERDLHYDLQVKHKALLEKYIPMSREASAQRRHEQEARQRAIARA